MRTATNYIIDTMKLVFSRHKIFNTTLGNLFGLQLMRIVLARAALNLRRRRCPERLNPYVKQLTRKGYCVVDNFLPPDEFERLRAEFDRAMNESGTIQEERPDRINVVTKIVSFTPKDRGRFPATVAAFCDNQAFLAVFRGHEGRTTDFEQMGTIKHMFLSNRLAEASVGEERSSESNNDVHADTFHTISKAFLYLNDVDENTGPHIYVPRSHRLSFSRLLFDYLNSITKKEGAPRASDKQLVRMGLRALPMVYPANTLIITNTQGFHARGPLRPGRERNIIYVQYRSEPYR